MKHDHGNRGSNVPSLGKNIKSSQKKNSGTWRRRRLIKNANQKETGSYNTYL